MIVRSNSNVEVYTFLLSLSKVIRILLFFCFFFLICPLSADNINVDPYFRSHMVLQRGRPIIIWGYSDPEVSFKVSLGNETNTVHSDINGKWETVFTKRKASYIPIELKVGDKLYDDILIGDVWICSGQSNMVFPISNSDNETKNIEESNDELSHIRILKYNGLRLTAKSGYTDNELKRCNTDSFFEYSWKKATINNLQSFSAVAAHFGIMLSEYENIPIGLVCCAIGGSAINNWIPENVLKSYDYTSNWFSTNWLENDKISKAHRKRAKEAFSKVLPLDGNYVIDKSDYHFLCEPSFLFESSFSKIGKIASKGVLWYQGEADSESVEAINRYGDFYNLLVESWRKNFNDCALPFISIQLPSYKAKYWPLMREVQYDVSVKNNNCYIVPTIDQGDYNDIHYKKKNIIGQRAAFLALDKVYRRKTKFFPSFKEWKQVKDTIIISFNDAENGLYISGGGSAEIDLYYKDGSKSNAKVCLNKNNEMIVPVGVKELEKITYAYKSSLLDTNLIYSNDNIPLYPFEINLK